MQRQSKVEIANAAGTPDQDAFFGYLNLAHIRFSHLQPNLITLLINTSALTDHTTWHLPSYDLKNEQKYLHKIHALDIYLWTEKDASTLLNHLKNVVGVDRIEIKDAPATRASYTNEHRDSMSPVVQQLERTAIGSSFTTRSASTVSAGSLPGPPTSAPAPAVGGYNPAAPAAPEPVTYREKTPPPPDDGTGTGLNHVSKYDSAAPVASATGYLPQQTHSAQSTPQPMYFSGPPSAPRPGPPSHAPSFGPMAASTIASPPSVSPPPTQQTTQYANFPAHVQQQQFSNVPGTPGYNSQLPPTPSAPPAYSGPLQSPGIPPPPQQHQVLGAPPGGFSSYSYASASSQTAMNQQGGFVGDTHGQLYRPTEAEMSIMHKGKPKRTATEGSLGSKEGKPKLEDSFGRLEGKVTGLLTKLDKMW